MRSLSVCQSFCVLAKALPQEEVHLLMPDVLGSDIVCYPHSLHPLTSTQGIDTRWFFNMDKPSVIPWNCVALLSFLHIILGCCRIHP